MDKAWLVGNELLQHGDRGDALVSRINAHFAKAVQTVKGTLKLLDTYGSPIWSRQLAEAFPHTTDASSRDKPILRCPPAGEGESPHRALDDLTEDLSDLLELFQVGRIIVGHTPQHDRKIKSRCGGKIILADIAMSEWMARHGAPRYPVALIMDTTSVSAEGARQTHPPIRAFTYNGANLVDSIRELPIYDAGF